MSMTWMTPLDWNTLACVTIDMPPFASFSTMSLPCIIAQSVSPLTVFSVARQVLFSATDVRGVWPMVRHYFFFGPRPSLTETYNPLQKLAYTSALGFGVVLAATGLALYKPVQLSGLVWAFGGVRLTRIWHFAAMTGLLGFIPGHLIMVALHGWSNFASMWTGLAEARD